MPFPRAAVLHKLSLPQGTVCQEQVVAVPHRVTSTVSKLALAWALLSMGVEVHEEDF